MLIEDYALVSVTPGVSGENTMMVLAGLYSEGTQAAAEYVTTDASLHELNQRLGGLKGPGSRAGYYQALLRVRVENSFPTRATLLTIRELQVAGQ